MSVQSYQELILNGINGLPEQTLAEIADFVYFVRLRVLGADDENSLYETILGLERAELIDETESHLDKEFAGYEQLYPRE